MFGWRKRIGYIGPTVMEVVPYEFYKFAPDGVGLVGPRDVAWAPLDSSELVVVSGRGGPPFRSRERRQLQQLCRVADARWYEVARTGARGAHPSGAKQFANQRLAVS